MTRVFSSVSCTPGCSGSIQAANLNSSWAICFAIASHTSLGNYPGTWLCQGMTRGACPPVRFVIRTTTYCSDNRFPYPDPAFRWNAKPSPAEARMRGPGGARKAVPVSACGGHTNGTPARPHVALRQAVMDAWMRQRGRGMLTVVRSSLAGAVRRQEWRLVDHKAREA